MINVKKDWWKDYFDQTYLITDARSVCDSGLTKREVDLIERLLDLDRNDRILDLFGGQGRHSLELARRNYSDLTVLDFSPYLIKLGRELARKENMKIKFYRRDARSTGLKKRGFSAVIVMANSFGYFSEEKDDIRVLREARRLLKKGGKLLLDLTDAGYVRKNLMPLSWHNAGDGITVFRVRKLEKDIVRANEIVVSRKKGLLRNGAYRERLYSPRKIAGILDNLSYRNISVRKGVSLNRRKKDYGFLTSRMIVTAAK